MAKLSQFITCGIDVSKDTLDIALSEDNVKQIPNTQAAIDRWLKRLSRSSEIAVESTGRYHEALVEQALEAGFTVYLINGKQLNHYREAVGPRAKTDTSDALLLRRYLSRERTHLTPVKPLNYSQKRLWQLLKRRATLVKTRARLKVSLQGDAELESLSQGIFAELAQTIKVIEKKMLALSKTLGWERDLAHCRSVPGIGPINALALVTCFHRGTFDRVDQFIAYLGLDVRVRDSGNKTGKRKLTKQGEPEMRRLLYIAAWAFSKHPKFRPLHEQMKGRGMSPVAANTAMARKLARIAFALMKKDEDFMLSA